MGSHMETAFLKYLRKVESSERFPVLEVGFAACGMHRGRTLLVVPCLCIERYAVSSTYATRTFKHRMSVRGRDQGPYPVALYATRCAVLVEPDGV
jgi:hypothetical protein